MEDPGTSPAAWGTLVVAMATELTPSDQRTGGACVNVTSWCFCIVDPYVVSLILSFRFGTAYVFLATTSDPFVLDSESLRPYKNRRSLLRSDVLSPDVDPVVPEPCDARRARELL